MRKKQRVEDNVKGEQLNMGCRTCDAVLHLILSICFEKSDLFLELMEFFRRLGGMMEGNCKEEKEG